MAAHSLHHHESKPNAWLDLLLILAGAMAAWLFWPATAIHH